MAVYFDLVGTNADRVAARKAVQVESPQMCATNNLFLLLNSTPPPHHGVFRNTFTFALNFNSQRATRSDLRPLYQGIYN